MFEVFWWSDSSVGVKIVDKEKLVLPLLRHVREALPGVTVKTGLDMVLVEASLPDIALQDKVIASLATYAPTSYEKHEGERKMFPVNYAGEDLPHVAEQLGVSVDTVTARHLSTVWEVAMIGFAPGFPYLTPADEEDRKFWGRVSRLDTPRKTTQAGSVAVAAGMSSIYPNIMPGGWPIIGYTESVLFDPSRQEPSSLRVGDIVQFVPLEGTSC